MTVPRRLSIACLLVAWLVVLVPPVAAATQPGGRYLDDNGSSAEPSIEAVVAAGVMSGCGGQRFCPESKLTRGQFALALSRALHLTKKAKHGFKDVAKGSSTATAARRVVAAGLLEPCATKRFCPKDPVSRKTFAKAIAKGFHLRAMDGHRYKDGPSSKAAKRAIDKVVTAGIMAPCSTKKFCPSRKVHRGQAAVYLRRALHLAPIVPPPPSTGNPTGHAPIPSDAAPGDSSDPDHVVGDGTPASCTSQAVVAAVAQGGVITFDCGPSPVTIPMAATARVFNDRPDIVLDGGGLVTLDGQGARRILYMNTCDKDLVWTTSHCQDQAHPTLTVQHLTFANGRSTGNGTEDGGGAIFVRGGRFKVVESSFTGNRCAPTGPDVGGAALQVFSQYHGRPVYILNSTFGGAGALHNECSNGGAISSIAVSWTILNSLFLDNRAIGTGANPPKNGSPGGGNGGAIYNDGNTMTLSVAGTRIAGNTSNGEGGSAIFFVSNDRSGSVVIDDSVLEDNTGDGFWTRPYHSIFFLGRKITVTDSTFD